MEINMNSKNQFDKKILDLCIKEIENAVNFYYSISLCGVGSLKSSALEFISEIIDYGRTNLNNFDHIYITIENKLMTIEEIDNLLFSESLSILTNSTSNATEIHHVKQ